MCKYSVAINEKPKTCISNGGRDFAVSVKVHFEKRVSSAPTSCDCIILFTVHFVSNPVPVSVPWSTLLSVCPFVTGPVPLFDLPLVVSGWLSHCQVIALTSTSHNSSNLEC